MGSCAWLALFCIQCAVLLCVGSAAPQHNRTSTKGEVRIERLMCSDNLRERLQATSTSQTSRQSICPWVWVHVDENNSEPSDLQYARCVCEVVHVNGNAFNCEPITVPMVVSDVDENGEWADEVVSLSVGCTARLVAD